MIFPALMMAGAKAHAQDAAKPEKADGITFLELFTAENCPFCPAAERNFNDIATDSGVIGVTCMVDYFDSGAPSLLSRPFCRDRQDIYVHMLKAGARYTPQMVINGSSQLPGQNLQKVSSAIQAARESADGPVELEISRSAEPGRYDVALPTMKNKAIKYVLRITLVRSSSDLSVLNAADQKRERSPHNIATALIEGGIWDGISTVWTIKPPADGLGDGFIVTVQEQNSGRVTAAGEYTFSE